MGPLKQRNDRDKNKGIYHMLNNKTGKPRKVQIQLLYTSGQKEEREQIIKQFENPPNKETIRF